MAYILKMTRVRTECATFILTVLFTIGTVTVCSYESHYIGKMRETKPGITLTKLEEGWGKPDGVYNRDEATSVLFYNNSFVGNRYVFIMSKKDNTLLSTFLDD